MNDCSLTGIIRRRRTILVVDDDAVFRSVLERSLKVAGFLVLTATDAEAALLSIEHDSPDLVLTDVYMPKRDGFELLKALSQHTRRIPIIVMSANHHLPAYNALRFARHLGADAALEKPFEIEALLALIDRLVPAKPVAQLEAARL